MPNISVIKANGDKEIFDITKVAKSLQRSGASKNEIKEVLKLLIPRLYNNISTKEIYSIVYSLLNTELKHHGLAGKYNLKKAIFDLGPSGYPFEKFMAGIFATQGFVTSTNFIAKGKCVSHEIDVVLKKDNKTTYMEAKFHKRQGFKVNIKTALYVFARYLDIAEANKDIDFYLVTNTKVTHEVIKYSMCTGLKLITWDYPNNGMSLRSLIDKSNLHPITILSSLPQITKNYLLREGVVFYEDLIKNQDKLSATEYKNAVEEFEKIHRV